LARRGGGAGRAGGGRRGGRHRKTRLVEQLAAEVADAGDADGGCVAWGTCAGPDAPPLWPWRAVLRELAAGLGPLVSRGALAVADLVDPAGDQARMYARIVGQLVDAAAERPVLVVLDDLHWADPDSLHLLRLTAGEVRRVPLLLVGTLRPDEVAAAPAVRETLSELASSTEAVHLDGLPGEAVARLVRDLIGREPTGELTAAVVRRTGGNPFFVRELLRLLVAEGGSTRRCPATGSRCRRRSGSRVRVRRPSASRHGDEWPPGAV
jgi:hypothetical protein